MNFVVEQFQSPKDTDNLIKQSKLKVNTSAEKHVQTGHDWFWFYFGFNETVLQVFQANYVLIAQQLC